MTTTATAQDDITPAAPAPEPAESAEANRWPGGEGRYTVPVDLSDAQLDFGFPELKALPPERFGGAMPDLLAIRREYLEGGAVSELIRPVVRASWERCRRAGLQPGTMRPQTPDAASLAAAREANRDLLGVAEPLLRKVHETFGEAPHSVALCDRRAVALLVLRDAVLAADPNAIAVNLFEGASWSEADVGSNGAGTSLAAGRPVVLIGPEHLADAFIDWTCLGVPLRNAAGEIVGALDLSVPNQGIRTEMWGWVLSIAQQIEARLRDGASAAVVEREGDWDKATSALSGITELLLCQLNLPPTHARFVEDVRQAISMAARQNLKTNRELKRTKELLEAVLDAAPAGILACDRAGEFLFSNPALDEILGGLPTGCAGKPDGRYTLHHLDGTPYAADLPLVRALGGEESSREELMVRRGDGSDVSAVVDAAPLRDGNGRIWGAVATMSDVTEQVKARQAIARSEEALREMVARYEQQVRLFESVASTTLDFVYLFDGEGRFLYANRRLQDVLGMTLAEIVGRTCREVGYQQWQHDTHMREIAQVIATKRAVKGEVPFKAPRTGIFGVYEYIFTPVLGPEGRVELIAGTTRDVTERHRAEESLRERQRVKTFLLEFTDRLRSLPDPARIPYAAARALGEHLMADRVVFAEAERGGERLDVQAQYAAGVDAADAPGGELLDGANFALLGRGRPVTVAHQAGAPVRREWSDAAAPAGQAGELLHVPVMKAGQLVAVVGVQYRALHLWTPDEVGLVEQAAERTWAALQQARAEEALREAQAKLQEHAANLESTVAQRTAMLTETVGELEHFSYTIAHDMRAPLRAMRGFGEILLEGYTDRLDEPGRGYLGRITAAAARMDNLITDALNYSKAMRMELMLEPIDPGSLIREIVELYPQFEESGAMIDVAEEFPPVLANKAGLTQCVSNLLDNAVKFVAPGRTPAIRIWGEQRGESVRLWFEDNGIGIPKDQQERVFGMFAQLNSSYEGTGIGLALVRKVAQRMQGCVGVESEPGQGSRFWLELRLGRE